MAEFQDMAQRITRAQQRCLGPRANYQQRRTDHQAALDALAACQEALQREERVGRSLARARIRTSSLGILLETKLKFRTGEKLRQNVSNAGDRINETERALYGEKQSP